MRITFCVLFLLCLSTQLIAQIDTDGDGLLDLLDHPSFDTNRWFYACGFGETDACGIQDLDGATRLSRYSNLYLSGNNITSLEAEDFEGLTNVQSLGLDGNQISNLEAGAFGGLPNLRWLYLTDNQITSLEAGTFAGLPNLQKLFLNRNHLTSIEADAFEGLTDLRFLDLNDNPLSSMEAGDFADLTNLEQLFLLGNRITSIEAGVFDDLSNLQKLNLSENQIKNLEAGAFEGLTNLQELALEGNQIKSLEAGAFEGLTNLQWLNLSENQITHLEAGTFTGLPNLMSLNLVSVDNWWVEVEIDTPIREVEDGAFEGLERLAYVSLAHSKDEMNLRGAEFQSLQTLSWHAPMPIKSLFLDDAELSSGSLSAILEFRHTLTEVSLVGLSFADSGPEDMSQLLGLTDLNDLTIDANLYSLYQDEFDAFAALNGKTLTIVDPDCNSDGVLDILDAICTPGRRVKYFLEDYATVPGDADGMGGVEFADFLILNSNFGQSPAVYTDGDFDVDGQVGFSDFLVLSGNYGQGGDFATEVAAVPEPSSGLIMIFSSLFLFRGRLAHR